MKCVTLIKKKNKQNLFLFFIFISISFFFYKGRLGGDDLQAFNFAYDLIYKFNFNLFELLKEDNSLWQFSHRKIWILQNILIIIFVKFISVFFNFDIISVSQYLCGLIITFYTVVSFFLFYKILTKNKINNELSLFISISVFFGTSLISFFTGAYIESFVIFIVLLRYLVDGEKSKIFFDSLLVLIKPYYIIVIICLLYNDQNINKKFIKHLFIVGLVIFVDKLLTLGAFQNFVTSLPYNFEFDFIIKNILDTFFSPGFGTFFTSSILMVLIIFGLNSKTLIKLFLLFIFILFLSTLTFWHGQSPGNRYLLSTLFIFVPEIINSIKKLKNYKIFLIFALVITILNLPSLEFRNTNIKNFSDQAVHTGLVLGVSDRDINAFPNNNYRFNNIIFSQEIFLNKILNNNDKEININQYNFLIKDVYPMTGFKRVIFILENDLNFLEIKKILIYKKKIILLFKILYFLTIILFIFQILRLFLMLINNK